MKLHEILAADLPDIDDSVKECVNMGQWLLFKTDVSTIGPNHPFYLKAGASVFELSDSGKIVQEVQRKDNLEVDEMFYFSDIRKPSSLSNMSI